MRLGCGAAMVVVALGALGAGCGGANREQQRSTATTPGTRPAPSDTGPRIDPAVLPPRAVPRRATGKADPAATRVIDAWLRALRAGDIRRAAAYFAVPSVFQNATPVLHLDTRQEVLAVNLSFPCGAVATRYGAAGRFTVVRFRLTSRVGGDCHGAEGHTTSGAISVVHGHIREWYRLYEARERGSQAA